MTLDFWPPGCERITLCYFKPPNLWCFVEVSLGNGTLSRTHGSLVYDNQVSDWLHIYGWMSFFNTNEKKSLILLLVYVVLGNLSSVRTEMYTLL